MYFSDCSNLRGTIISQSDTPNLHEETLFRAAWQKHVIGLLGKNAFEIIGVDFLNFEKWCNKWHTTQFHLVLKEALMTFGSLPSLTDWLAVNTSFPPVYITMIKRQELYLFSQGFSCLTHSKKVFLITVDVSASWLTHGHGTYTTSSTKVCFRLPLLVEQPQTKNAAKK